MSEEQTEVPQENTEAQRLEAAISLMEPEAAVEESEEPVEVAQAEEAVEDTQKQEEEDPLSTRLAVLSRKERQAKEEHRKRVAEVAEKEKAISDAKSKLADYESAKDMAARDPIRLLKSLGVDKGFAEIAKTLWYEELGDDAPKDAHVDKRFQELAHEVRILRQEREEMRQQQEQQQAAQEQQQMVDDYRAELSSLEPSDGLPYVSAMLRNGKDKAIDALFQVAVVHAQGDPEGKPLTPAECAQALNDALEQEYKLLGVSLVPEENEKSPPKKTAPKTLNTKQTAQRAVNNQGALTDEERMARAVAVIEGQ